MAETRRERFMRIMAKRVNRIKHEHRLLGNLANKYNYDYDLAMVNQVEDELVKDLDYHLQKFAEEKLKPFQFKD
jgi:hypothetical protein